MAYRIADLVNTTLSENGEEVQLSSSEILDLIDMGRSEGGGEVEFIHDGTNLPCFVMYKQHSYG